MAASDESAQDAGSHAGLYIGERRRVEPPNIMHREWAHSKNMELLEVVAPANFKTFDGPPMIVPAPKQAAKKSPAKAAKKAPAKKAAKKAAKK